MCSLEQNVCVSVLCSCYSKCLLVHVTLLYDERLCTSMATRFFVDVPNITATTALRTHACNAMHRMCLYTFLHIQQLLCVVTRAICLCIVCVCIVCVCIVCVCIVCVCIVCVCV
jgi:hypothetical protein